MPKQKGPRNLPYPTLQYTHSLLPFVKRCCYKFCENILMEHAARWEDWKHLATNSSAGAVPTSLSSRARRSSETFPCLGRWKILESQPLPGFPSIASILAIAAASSCAKYYVMSGKKKEKIMAIDLFICLSLLVFRFTLQVSCTSLLTLMWTCARTVWNAFD